MSYNRLLADVWTRPGVELKPIISEAKQEITVAFLAVEYGKFAKNRYRKSNGELKNEWTNFVKNILREVRATYGQ